MSTQAINDYLEKQLFIERNVVTYRSLSREFAIHVNEAKNELELYWEHASTQDCRQPPSATYLITGEQMPQRTRFEDDFAMSIDAEDDVRGSQEGYSDADDQDIPEVSVVLVDEPELEDVKSQFLRTYSVHVYSLSPSPIRDAGFLTAPTDIVRRIDGSKKGLEISSIVGKVISKQIKAKPGVITTHAASTSKPKYTLPVASSSKAGKVQEVEQAKPPAKKEPLTKPKPTGKLDFSKAKTKEEKKAEAKEPSEAKLPQNGKKPEASSSSSNLKADTVAGKAPKKEEPKRGVKRKSVGLSHSETESNTDSTASRVKPKLVGKSATRQRKSLKPSSALLSDDDDAVSAMSDVQPTTKNQPKVINQRGVILSDDENGPLPPRRRKITRKESEAERSLREMMDIDDEEVTRVSRSKASEPEPANDAVDEDEDVEMTDNTDIVPAKPKQKRAKKVVPVGRNGLKKRRVVKSRTKLDDKGYMVTEDYSEYESVDEEEPEPEKTKGKKKATTVKASTPATSKATEKQKATSADTENTVSSAAKGKAAVKKSISAAKTLARTASKSGKSNTATKLSHKGSIVNFFGPAKNK